MKTERTLVLSTPVRAGTSTDRNLPWRRAVKSPRFQKAPRVVGNSPVPLRTPGANPLDENLSLSSAAATRALPKPNFGEEQRPELLHRFQELADRWREETEFNSAISALYMHPAYQEIVGMGPDVLPLLLEDLAATRTDWFWALRAISGENPVPASERGKINRMTERWLAWGHERGLL